MLQDHRHLARGHQHGLSGAQSLSSVGGGSAMMTEMDKTAALVRGMVDAVKIPVTAKMRLGWDDENLTAPDLARALEDAGVAAIFVHGRTREQGFGGTRQSARHSRRREGRAKAFPSLATATSPRRKPPKKMFDETGCAGVSIGRGAFYNPWIFQHTRQYLANRRTSSRAELRRTAPRHAASS